MHRLEGGVRAGDYRSLGHVQPLQIASSAVSQEQGAAGEVDNVVAVGGDGSHEGCNAWLSPGYAEQRQHVTTDIRARDCAVDVDNDQAAGVSRGERPAERAHLNGAGSSVWTAES